MCVFFSSEIKFVLIMSTFHDVHLLWLITDYYSENSKLSFIFDSCSSFPTQIVPHSSANKVQPTFYGYFCPGTFWFLLARSPRDFLAC